MIQRICLLALCGVSVSGAATADITRDCRASVEFFISDHRPNALASVGEITGRGSCANVIQADKCRERARQALNACISQMWGSRHQNSVPAACNSIVDGSSRSGARLSYLGIIPIQESRRLTARASFMVCCHMRPQAAVVMGGFGGRITGDRKCAAHKIGNDRYQEEYGFGSYQMNCAALRAQGLCQAN